MNDATEGLKALRGLRAEHLKIGETIAVGNIYSLDLLAFAVLNRSLCLSFGFATLLEQRNFISAAPLLRLQLDNALRFYASTRVSKPHDFAHAVLAGESIRKMKDSGGELHTDTHLLSSFVADSRLDIERSWVESVYRQTSSYVHLSEQHIFNCLQAGDVGRLRMKISEVDEFVTDSVYIESISAMTEATRLTLAVVSHWARESQLLR